MKTFEWVELAFLAKELLVSTFFEAPSEVRFRTSINRSYYAAFWLAASYIRQQEGDDDYMRYVSSGPSSHQKLIEYFEPGGSSSNSLPKVKTALARMSQNRINADYPDKQPENYQKKAKENLINYNKIASVLNSTKCINLSELKK